ncbi:MAG: PDZ domain-containing protein, partial [Thermoplasmatota archaeon]
TLLYQPHEHNINRNVSYYGKGQFIALCLEAHLRRNGATEGLDAVMRHLWKHHGDAGAGVPEGSAAVAAIVQEATGVDCRRELARWVDGTGELPIAAALRDLGWDLKRDHSDPKNKLALGVHFKAGGDDGRPVIERIPEDVPAAAVLQPDDELVAVEGYAWSKARLQQAASTREAGDTVRLAVFREGRLRELDVPLWEKPPDKLTITPRKGDAVATRRRNAWLATGS